MPSYALSTNVSEDKITPLFLSDLSKKVSKLTGKPENYVHVRVNVNQFQLFGGSSDPCATSSIENIGELNTGEFTKEMNTFIHKSLGIPVDRIAIFFYQFKGSNVGYGLSTF